MQMTQPTGRQNAGTQNAGPQDTGPQNAGPQDTGPEDIGRQSRKRPTDSELIAMALAGDQAGFEGLVGRYQDRLFVALLGMVQCPGLAEDIAQDAFVKAFLNLHAFRRDSHFYTWLFRIALNSRRRYFRTRNRTTSLDSVAEIDQDRIANVDESPPAAAQLDETRTEIRSALARLSESQRKILMMREFEGFSYRAIAGILGICLGTVRSRISRARDELRRELKRPLPR